MNRGTHNYRKSFGKSLKAIRTSRKFSQEELAHRAGIDRTYVSIIELGQKSPTLDVVVQLCTALGVSPSFLLQEAEKHMSGRA